MVGSLRDRQCTYDLVNKGRSEFEEKACEKHDEQKEKGTNEYNHSTTVKV